MLFSNLRLVSGLVIVSALLAGCGASDGDNSTFTSPISDNGDSNQNQTNEMEQVITPEQPAAGKQRAPLETVSADAFTLGEFAADITDIDYEFDEITVTDDSPRRTNTLQYSTDVHGYVKYSTSAPTPMPVILLLHGRHQTCETNPGEAPVLFLDDDQCPNAVVINPAPSYRGYDYLAEYLASHGYFVLSIDANDINDSDGSPNAGDAGANARAQLIQAHLDAFRDINDGKAASGEDADTFENLAGALNMMRIGTMGHSRGGDGVSRFISYNRQQANPHNIVATFALAPTDYNADVVDGATFATLLPYCDGDVEDVQGAFIYDDSRLLKTDDEAAKFQILTMGSNHNYFNTAWPSDDWTIWDSGSTDPFCGQAENRDNPQQQRTIGQFFMASFFQYFVGENDEFANYWNGRGQIPEDVCRNDDTSCEDRHHLTLTAPASQRVIINSFASADSLSINNLGGLVSLSGFDRTDFCKPERDGSGCPSSHTFNTAGQVALGWSAAGASVRQSLTEQDFTQFDLLTIRLAVSTLNTTENQDFTLVLTDIFGNQQQFQAS